MRILERSIVKHTIFKRNNFQNRYGSENETSSMVFF